MRSFSRADVPDVLPVFPLPGALVFPRARLPLNIFEPRYIAMIDDVLSGPHRLIGMIQPKPNQEGDTPALYQVGCAGRLVGFTETPDGRYLINLTGVARFRLKAEVEGFAPYRRAEVDFAPFDADFGDPADDPALDRDAFLATFDAYAAAKGLSADRDALDEADAEMLINALSMLLPFAANEKQALLEAQTLVERRQALTTLMAISAVGGGGAVQ